MNPTFLVMAGGAIGAGLRYHVGRLLDTVPAGGFPLATFAINVSGALCMGLVTGWLMRFGAGGGDSRLLLAVGVLGGFTTFSAFSLELVTLIERGAFGMALAYALGSVVAAALALFGGLTLMRPVAG